MAADCQARLVNGWSVECPRHGTVYRGPDFFADFVAATHTEVDDSLARQLDTDPRSLTVEQREALARYHKVERAFVDQWIETLADELKINRRYGHDPYRSRITL